MFSKGISRKDGAYYQYTAIDEKTRYRWIWFSKEKSTYTSIQFVKYLIDNAPFRIRCIQTDNGFEFTNKLNKKIDEETLFEKKLRLERIKHKIIRPYTPRHNGKVERSHRKDQEYFYDRNVFKNFEDLKVNGKKWIKKSNEFTIRPLSLKKPKDVLKSCLGVTRLRI